MRAVFVNHCHPDMPHVCALRLRKFADAFAAMGHQVVLLTETMAEGDSCISPEDLPETLANHDWSRPYYLSIKPVHDDTLSKLRGGQIGWLLRKAIIASRYLFENGLYGDWRRGAEPYLKPLAQAFKPDVIWASFGNTGVWNIARDLSETANCPWVADIKDNWQHFIPVGLRRLIAARFKDAAHMTCFSKSHLAEADQWFAQQKIAVYSGFDEKVLDASEPPSDPAFEILLTGSVYGDDDFKAFIDGLEHWLRNRDAGPVRFIYAGNDHQRIREFSQKLLPLCELDIRAFMNIDDLLAAQRRANLNAYIRLPNPYHFHHKAIELMAAGKPVICFPKEGDETVEIMARANGTLYSCASRDDVETGLSKAYEAAKLKSNKTLNKSVLLEYSWQGQARVLETVLDNARRRP